MPLADSRRIYEDHIPSFMSVFDLDAETMADRETVTLVHSKLGDMESKPHTLAPATRRADMSAACLTSDPNQPARNRNSPLTQMSESADSSPTTTLSTTDSSPVSDPSPSSSPDSPLNLIPLKNYPSTTFGPQSKNLSMHQPRRLDTSLTTLERPMTSPAPRRPRNMKGLSIQAPAAATVMSKSTAMEPLSPSFIRPTIPAMKRKPSLLSIKTNATDLITNTSLQIPASPALPPILQRRALKHSASSPHMLISIKTASFGPPGGMTFPSMLERNQSGLSEVLRPMKTSTHATFAEAIAEEESPIRMQLASRGDFRAAENNEDQKSPGYPEGPIAIYGNNVYLYSEPTADEASRFDVVINVAREVRNPFGAKRESLMLSPVPDTAVSNASYRTAWEYQPEDRYLETPTTPKASPLRAPEYIHIPWDHNTDIAPDLMPLCATIASRVDQGKRVLIHCQQGASRSASLIIAFGLYQKPELSVNDAYYAAQGKSRWISPNMKLMYSLQDFHKELTKKYSSPNLSLPRPRLRSSALKHKPSLSSNAVMDPDSTEPQTAPLPAEDGGGDHQGPRAGGVPKRLASNLSGLQTVSPGPASAPLTFSWRENTEEKKEEQDEMEVVEEDQSRNESSHNDDHLQPLSIFRFQSQPKRPKSAQGASKATLAPIVLPDAKRGTMQETELHQGLGQLIHRSPCSTQYPSHLSRELSPIESIGPFPLAYSGGDEVASPRAEVMMGGALRKMSEAPGMCSPGPSENLFSPRENMFSRSVFFPFSQATQMVDPRSPPTKGEAPIIRSIDDIL